MLLVLLIVGLTLWSRSGRSGPTIEVAFSRNPEVICRSSSCVVTVGWDVTSDGSNLAVSVVLVRPDGQEVPISQAAAGTQGLGADDPTFFAGTGVYTLELRATADEAEDRIEQLRVAYHEESEFRLVDAWNTGFTGGALSDDETAATHSLVLTQEPFVGSVTEIDGKVPSSVTLCSKSTALRTIVYSEGTIRADGTGIRRLEVVARRPGGAAIATRTLNLGDELPLTPEFMIDDGIEILSTMRSEADPPRSIAGSTWRLTYVLGCIDV